MKNYDDLILKITEQNTQLIEKNTQLIEENKRIKDRLDIALNTITLQAEEIQHLKDEIAILKGQKPRPKIPPSTLEGSQSVDKQNNKQKNSRGKHPRQKKTSQLNIHARNRIKPDSVPEGAVFKGCQKYTVQDIILRSYNTIYELERWQLPDGTYLTGKLSQNIQGHYGPQLISFILHQYYGCRVTEPLLLIQLKEIGVLISKGQLSNILIQRNEVFHQEKNELLLAGIEATGQIKVDDTGARHQGKNGYSTIIGNDFFTYIVSTKSKSRINFLQILNGADPRYLINEDTADYIEALNPSHWLGRYFLLQSQNRSMSKDEWEKFLLKINIQSKADIKLVTEAALFASLIENGIPRDLGVHGDDARQFNVFIRSLCWIHEERHYRKLIPIDEATRCKIEEIRGEIWDLYNGLKEYKITPSESLKSILEQNFDNLFLKKKTSSPTLNKQLAKTYAKKDKLLRVLERPGTPLHNNGTETDAREMVVKRKVSGGTRSKEGQRCRDTFVSLKKTCSKLGISFLNYLEDRVNGIFEIPMLEKVIFTHSSGSPNSP